MIIMKEQGMIQVIDWLNKVTVDFPDVVDRNAWNVAEMVAGELRKAKNQAGIEDFTGSLSRSLKARKIKKNVYVIPIPLHAYMLDSMKPHRVNMYGPSTGSGGTLGSGGRKSLAEWMLRKYGVVFASIYVQPRPFIGNAMLATAQRLRPELENGVMLKSLRRGAKK